MNSKKDPISITYKAAIVQDTGEAWVDASLTLGTATPTYGVGLPALPPWNVSLFQLRPIQPRYREGSPSSERSRRRDRYHRSRSRSRSPSRRPIQDYKRMAADDVLDVMRYSGLIVASTNNVNTTFRVPGFATIPSDKAAHYFTIAELDVSAEMSWFCAPKIDTRVHLKAKVQNKSEYAMLKGTANIYVDGSFISRTQISAVSPLESFECPLGIDPSIKVTYPPMTRKVSTTGIYPSKKALHSFSQRISIANTNTSPIVGGALRFLDRIPVAQDSKIDIKLTSPPLKASSNQVKVAEGVVAQWDEEGQGKDGKLCWLCSLPAEEQVNLTLQWDVVTPEKEQAVRLSRRCLRALNTVSADRSDGDFHICVSLMGPISGDDES